jgi:S-formylglutathione hydrolase FrmB
MHVPTFRCDGKSSFYVIEFKERLGTKQAPSLKFALHARASGLSPSGPAAMHACRIPRHAQLGRYRSTSSIGPCLDPESSAPIRGKLLQYFYRNTTAIFVF